MKRLLLVLSAFTVMLAVSCTDTDVMQEDIDRLSERVAKMEELTSGLNTSFNALHKLMDESLVIVGISRNDKGYDIDLSDGASVPVIIGEEIPVTVPSMGIDAEGFWTVTVNGETSRLLVDGRPVSAWPVEDGEHKETAEGATPQIGVDAEGFWIVSTDGGKNWKQVLMDGKPVPATGDNAEIGYSSVFKAVEYDEARKLLTITLIDGDKTLSFPVRCDFGISIKAAAPVKVHLGETLVFEVEQENVAEAIIKAPKGWKAELSEKELSITAPATGTAGKQDICLLVTSPNNWLKTIHLEMNLLATAIDANACKAWQNFADGNSGNVLIDYSYAGYHHGEEAPADVWGLGYTVYDVTKYGLDPTGKTSSRAAFIKLMTDLGLTGKTASGSNKNNPNAKAVIYFPEGSYILHNEEDNTISGGSTHSEGMILLGGNFVIKGAGRDKTRIIMDSPNYPATSDLWSSPVMLTIKHNSGLSKIGEVTEDAAAGSFSVTCSSTSGLSKGDWVMLKLEDNSPELVASQLNPYTAGSAMSDVKTIRILDCHQIASISGNTLTFAEPLIYPVESKWAWTINKYPHYENVGVEDLTFVGHAKEKFGHHASWEDDGAYKPLTMMRLVDSWCRRVGFESVSEGLTFASSANCSVYDITISGNRGHSSVRSQGSSRLFIGKVIDTADGYECTTSGGGVGNTFMTGAGQYHGAGVSNEALGTVLWQNRWGQDALFESHAKQPRATLVDNCSGGFVQWRFGGDASNVPNHMQDLTIWNMNATRSSHEFGSSVFRWWLRDNSWWKVLPPVIVGFHGIDVNFALTDEAGDPQAKYIESNGTAVEPASLYEAQLRKRLSHVPAWLNSLK